MKVYTKVTSGMEMKMARGRFLGAVAKSLSVSPLGAGGQGAGVRRGAGDPAAGTLSLNLLHPLGALGQGRGQHRCLSRPATLPWAD